MIRLLLQLVRLQPQLQPLHRLTFVLTTNVDTGTAFTGGDGDDTFIADNTNGVTGEATLQRYTYGWCWC